MGCWLDFSVHWWRVAGTERTGETPVSTTKELWRLPRFSISGATRPRRADSREHPETLRGFFRTAWGGCGHRHFTSHGPSEAGRPSGRSPQEKPAWIRQGGAILARIPAVRWEHVPKHSPRGMGTSRRFSARGAPNERDVNSPGGLAAPSDGSQSAHPEGRA